MDMLPLEGPNDATCNTGLWSVVQLCCIWFGYVGRELSVLKSKALHTDGTTVKCHYTNK